MPFSFLFHSSTLLSASQQEVQALMMRAQQEAMVQVRGVLFFPLACSPKRASFTQEAIFKLTELAFDKCVTRPGSAMSSSEKSCIEQMTERYLDTSKFVLARFQNQAQQAQGGGFS